VPEGDNVHRLAQRLDAALTGSVVTRFELRVPAFAEVDLAGFTVRSVANHGKHLLMRIGESTVHSHLRMEGAWRLYAPAHDEREAANWAASGWAVPGRTVRAVIGTEHRVAVGYDLGLLEVLPTSREADAVGHLGPDVTTAQWDAAEAVRRLRLEPATPIGVALADQRAISGLGNEYVNEICFLRGIRPSRPVGEVADLPALVALARRLVSANLGRSRRITTGDTRPGHRLWVHGRAGLPCRRCGTLVESGRLGADPTRLRHSFWCPYCQT